MKPLQNYFATIRGTKLLLQMAQDPANEAITVYSCETKEESMRDYEYALLAMQTAKIFELSPTIMKLLCNTDNVITPTRLPFSPTWIECKLELDDIWMPSGRYVLKQKYLGFLLIEGAPLNQDTRLGQLTHLVQDGKTLLEEPYPNIYIFAVTEDETGIGHLKFSLYKEYTDSNIPLESKWEAERDQIRCFIMNFLDFLNDPDVEIVETLRSNKSIRKAMARHKKIDFVKPSNIVRLTGKLKVYIDSLVRHIESNAHYSHRFWVRGHWRHFNSNYYKAMRGRKVWIPPYVKGEGLLRPKRYFVNRVEEPEEILCQEKRTD